MNVQRCHRSSRPQSYLESRYKTGGAQPSNPADSARSGVKVLVAQVMSNPLHLQCVLERPEFGKKKKIQLAHLPVDLPVTLWPGDCVVESQHMSSTGLGEELLPSNPWGMSFSHTTCLNLELPDGACPNHRKAWPESRRSSGYSEPQINTLRMLNLTK